MRALLVPAALAASLALAPAAFAAAAQSATGSVKSYDAKTHTVTLQDGTAYMLPAHFKSHLKTGEKIQINWVKKGDMNDATSVKIVK